MSYHGRMVPFLLFSVFQEEHHRPTRVMQPLREHLKKMKDLRANCCAIITKPPETVMIYVPNGAQEIFFFDPHARDNMGAQWATFTDTQDLQDYLAEQVLALPWDDLEVGRP